LAGGLEQSGTRGRAHARTQAVPHHAVAQMLPPGERWGAAGFPSNRNAATAQVGAGAGRSWVAWVKTPSSVDNTSYVSHASTARCHQACDLHTGAISVAAAPCRKILSSTDAINWNGGLHQQFSPRQLCCIALTPAVPGSAVAE